MPKVTEKVSKAAYNALQNIVGPEWVTDDVAITESYVKGGEIHDCIYQRGQQPPAWWSCPRTPKRCRRSSRSACATTCPTPPSEPSGGALRR